MFFRSLGAQAVLIEMNHLSSLTMGDEATTSKYFSFFHARRQKHESVDDSDYWGWNFENFENSQISDNYNG